MLVDHLADAVLQQHHELVKGIDLTLQLDAVDEVDGYRHPLLAQGVQKGILQGLAFGHRVLLIFCSFVLFDWTNRPQVNFRVPRSGHRSAGRYVRAARLAAGEQESSSAVASRRAHWRSRAAAARPAVRLCNKLPALAGSAGRRWTRYARPLAGPGRPVPRAAPAIRAGRRAR